MGHQAETPPGRPKQVVRHPLVVGLWSASGLSRLVSGGCVLPGRAVLVLVGPGPLEGMSSTGGAAGGSYRHRHTADNPGVGSAGHCHVRVYIPNNQNLKSARCS
jgi:hypothetical protein